MHLRDLLRIDQQTFETNYDVITLDRVISEVKDEKSREYLLNKLPYEIDVKNAETFLDREDLIWVQNFAKDTGDYQTLSKVDQLVISLGIKLARIRGEDHLVRREPKGLSEFKPDRLKEAYDAFSGSDDESSDEDVKQSQNDDDWNNVEEDRQTKRTNARK